MVTLLQLPVPLVVVVDPPVVAMLLVVPVPPMPVEVDIDVEELPLPEAVEWVVMPVVPLPLLELHAPRLAPVVHPMIAPAMSHAFFMKRPSKKLVAAP